MLSEETLFSQVLTVIPARYGSTRFPGKPLASLHGKPMLAHTYRRAKESKLTGPVLIATDDKRIQTVAQGFGARVEMTSEHHPSGSDRVWEVAERYPDYPYILNLQGDEPFLNPDHINQLIHSITSFPKADFWTLTCRLPALFDPEFERQYANPNLVKAVRSQKGQILYCSRSPVPMIRDLGATSQEATANHQTLPIFRHIGIYLYRRETLARLSQLPPSPLEGLEKLEQLRALEAGLTLYAAVVDRAPDGVDTPADLERLSREAPVATSSYAKVKNATSVS